MKSEVAQRRINSFAKRFGRKHLILAYHGAFPLALTPDLLYKLWANFQRDIHDNVLAIPWVAVADLLLSSLCQEVGYELYEMDRTVRNILLQQLKDDSDFGQKRIEELSDFLLTYIKNQINSHDPDVRVFATTQHSAALAYVKPNQAALELRQALDKAFSEDDQAEQIRLTSLIETLAEPLKGFEPILVYKRQIRFKRTNIPQFNGVIFGEIYINNKIIKLFVGDLTDLETDVIVNSTNSDFIPAGTGVSMRIAIAGGEEIYEEAQQQAPLTVGKIVVTNAGKLKAKKIFHTLIVDYFAQILPEKKNIIKTVNSCLAQVHNLNYQSIAFPLLGTGAGNYSLEKGLTIIVGQVLVDLSKANSQVKEVFIALYASKNRELELEQFSKIVEATVQNFVSKSNNFKNSSKVVRLNLGEGSLSKGFPTVTAEIWSGKDYLLDELSAMLPPAPKLDRLYEQWRSDYHNFPLALSDQTQNSANKLRNALNSWVNSDSFRPIKDGLVAKLSPCEEVPIILHTQNPKERQLPWHLVLEDYSDGVEIAISPSNYPAYPVVNTAPSKNRNRERPIRILAIFAQSRQEVVEEINILQRLPSSQTVILHRPSYEDLDRYLQDEQGWDIVYFSDHSHQTDGNISYRDVGVEIGILNVNRGVDLGTQLCALGVHQVVTTREKLRPSVAVEFLRHFFEAFTSGKSLYMSVRQGRQKLQEFERAYPGTSWLPVVIQNPNTTPPTWSDLLAQKSDYFSENI